MRYLQIFFLLFAFEQAVAFTRVPTSPYFSDIEESMVAQWRSKGSLQRDLTAAILIAEGLNSPSEIEGFKTSLARVYTALDSQIQTGQTTFDKGRKISDYLHQNVLREYVKDAQFKLLFKSGQFNCVSSTVLYYLCASRYHIPLKIYTTPNHVYCAIRQTDGSEVRIEPTSPGGFDFKPKTQDGLLKYFQEFQLVTPAEIKRYNFDGVYKRVKDRTRHIAPEMLISVVYNNTGVYYWNRKSYQEAMDSYEKALLIDPKDPTYKETYESAYTYAAKAFSDAQQYNQLIPLFDRVLAFPHDYGFLEVHFLPTVGAASQYFSLNKGDYARAGQVLEHVRSLLKGNTAALKELEKYSANLEYNQAVQHNRAADYQTSYAQISGQYARNRNDAETRDAYIGIACNYAADLAKKGQLSAAVSLVDSLQEQFATDRRVQDTYLFVTANEIEAKAGQKNYAAALKQARHLLTIYPADPRVIDLYVGSGCNDAIQQAQQGHTAEAEKAIELLLADYPDRANVKKTYVDIGLFVVNQQKLLDQDPAEARNKLDMLFTVDDSRADVRQTLAEAYNRLAIRESDKGNLPALKDAKSWLHQGLRVDPENVNLKKNMEIIKQKIKALGG